MSVPTNMPKGKRALTIDDYWQDGDEYNGGQGWWRVGRDAGHPSMFGKRIDIGYMCYHPRGSIRRRRKPHR